MGEFDQFFGQSAPAEPKTVTLDVAGGDASSLEAFCQCMAVIASGSGGAPAQSLLPGLQAIQNVLWQIQNGFGLAASGQGWTATYVDTSPVGRKVLTFSGSGNELQFQLDSTGRIFTGGWRRSAGTLNFTIEPQAGGSCLHTHAPAEARIPLGVVVTNWTTTPQIYDQPATEGIPGIVPSPPPAAPPPPVVSETTEPAQEARWLLTIRTGERSGKKLELHGTMRAGRSSQNEIALPDDSTSRHHASFEVTGSGCTVSDLGSTNGTKVNGGKISKPTSLKDGDVVLCGETEMLITYVSPPAHAAAPLAPPAFPPPPPPPPKPAVPPPAPEPHWGGVQEQPAAQPAWAAPTPSPPVTAPPAPGSPEPATIFCQFCGRQLVGSPKFCFHCGHQLRH